MLIAQEAVAAAEEAAQRIGVGVTREAQTLFDALAKTCARRRRTAERCFPRSSLNILGSAPAVPFLLCLSHKAPFPLLVGRAT